MTIDNFQGGSTRHTPSTTPGTPLTAYLICPQIRFCTHEFDPVCGDNGVTFSNLCNLQIAQCLHDIDIEVIKHGVCDEPGNQDETDEENSSTLAGITLILPPRHFNIVIGFFPDEIR